MLNTQQILMAKLTRSYKDELERRIKNSMELLLQGLITMREYLECTEDLISQYKINISVQSDLIDSTEPYSNDRYEILNNIYHTYG